MAKQLIDLTTAGLVIGDLTFDWVKKLSNNASVSQTDHTLTERGNGIYVYNNPNVTEDSDFRIHITADSSKYAVGYLSPYDGIAPLNVLSATGYVKNIYWASGGKYFIKESEDIDIPFGFEGNPTGLELWFVIGKDLKNAPLVTKELIEGVDWNVVDIEGVDTVEGIIPFAYADTDTLHGKYTAAVIVKTSETEAYTGWESLLIVDRPVARAEDLV